MGGTTGFIMKIAPTEPMLEQARIMKRMTLQLKLALTEKECQEAAHFTSEDGALYYEFKLEQVRELKRELEDIK